MSIETLEATEKRNRTPLYTGVAMGITVWTVGMLFLAIKLLSIDVYWLSYYAVDYTFGFVRRGLAGEIVGLAPPGWYFDVALTLRWLSTAVFLASLATVMSVLLFTGRRSERKIMLALLIPVAPFAIVFSLYSARPDLFGAAALVMLAIFLTFTTSARTAVACCAGYGCLTAVLGLVHEAIGLEFALGAVLAVLVLGRGLTPSKRQWCAALAVIPGLLSASVVAMFGRHGVAAQLCSVVPHGAMDNPLRSITSPSTALDYLAGGPKAQTDFHDWVCRNVLRYYDYSVPEAVKVVAGIGVVPLLASLLLGVFLLAVTVLAIRLFSGVPLSEFSEPLRGRATLWCAFAAALVIPVFLTGFDWTRWLIIMSFDIVIVYLLFAANRPEIDEEPPKLTVQLFVLTVIVAALIPVGAVPGFGGPLMV